MSDEASPLPEGTGDGREQYGVVNGWLFEYVNEHTCGTGRDGYFGAHEPGCGTVPIARVEDLLQVADPAPPALPEGRADGREAECGVIFPHYPHEFYTRLHCDGHAPAPAVPVGVQTEPCGACDDGCVPGTDNETCPRCKGRLALPVGVQPEPAEEPCVCSSYPTSPAHAIECWDGFPPRPAVPVVHPEPTLEGNQP